SDQPSQRAQRRDEPGRPASPPPPRPWATRGRGLASGTRGPCVLPAGSRRVSRVISSKGLVIMRHQSNPRKLVLGSALLLAWACRAAPARGGGLAALASFNGSNGALPNGGVTFDSLGNLYGTAFSGSGSSGFGTVWELAKGSSTITALASFNFTNGAFPG